MQFLLGVLVFASWVWSVARGIQVSFLCAVLNFIFPPFSQLFFSIYEDKMRAPTFFMVGGSVALLYVSGKLGIHVTL